MAMALVLAGALFVGRSEPDVSIEARSERIASSIRCAVCQGQSVAESRATSARAIYDEIVRRVEAGESDDAIRTYVAGRYGTELLLRPSSSGAGSVVWIVPVMLGVLAIAGLVAAFVKWRPQRGAALSDVDRAVVARARRQLRHGSSDTAEHAVVDDADPDAELAALTLPGHEDAHAE
jgi:cytochrome c-type biogenesis protein CcmH